MAEKELVINAENLPLGRLAAFVAKQALLGSKVTIANCEKAVISGGKKSILADYQQRRARGTPEKGPFFPKSADGIVRRAVRGMLSYKKGKSRDAFSRVRCVNGSVNGMIEIKVKKGTLQRSITVGEISNLL